MMHLFVSNTKLRDTLFSYKNGYFSFSRMEKYKEFFNKERRMLSQLSETKKVISLKKREFHQNEFAEVKETILET